MDLVSACARLGIGVLVSSALVLIIANRRLWPKWPGTREFNLGQTAGVLWITAQTIGTVAMTHVAMSVSWPVTNLSTLIAIEWGVWVSKEVHIEKHLREVVVSIVLYSAGLGLLAVAAPHGRV